MGIGDAKNGLETSGSKNSVGILLSQEGTPVDRCDLFILGTSLRKDQLKSLISMLTGQQVRCECEKGLAHVG
jgi:hypothetical protein